VRRRRRLLRLRLLLRLQAPPDGARPRARLRGGARAGAR
jgi:hypothetical protein